MRSSFTQILCSEVILTLAKKKVITCKSTSLTYSIYWLSLCSYHGPLWFYQYLPTILAFFLRFPYQSFEFCLNLGVDSKIFFNIQDTFLAKLSLTKVYPTHPDTLHPNIFFSFLQSITLKYLSFLVCSLALHCGLWERCNGFGHVGIFISY